MVTKRLLQSSICSLQMNAPYKGGQLNEIDILRPKSETRDDAIIAFRLSERAAAWFQLIALRHEHRLSGWKFAVVVLAIMLVPASLLGNWISVVLLVLVLICGGFLVREFGYTRRLAQSYVNGHGIEGEVPVSDQEITAAKQALQTARFEDGGNVVRIPDNPNSFFLVLFMTDPAIVRLQSGIVGRRLKEPLKHAFPQHHSKPMVSTILNSFQSVTHFHEETHYNDNRAVNFIIPAAVPTNPTTTSAAVSAENADKRIGRNHFFYKLDPDDAKRRLKELQDGLNLKQAWIGVYVEVAIRKVHQHPRAKHSEIKRAIEQALKTDRRWIMGRPSFVTAHEVFSPEGNGSYSWVREYFQDLNFSHRSVNPVQGNLGI